MTFSLVHVILGIRAQPFSFGGRADSQDRMDQIGDVRDERLRLP